MPTPDSRIARAFIRAALRSRESYVRTLARAIARPAGVLKTDHTYDLSDRAAIDLAARITGALAARTARQDLLW